MTLVNYLSTIMKTAVFYEIKRSSGRWLFPLLSQPALWKLPARFHTVPSRSFCLGGGVPSTDLKSINSSDIEECAETYLSICLQL